MAVLDSGIGQAYVFGMPDLDLKPTEVRRSEKAPVLAIIWWLACSAFLFWLGLAYSGWDWKLALIFAVPAWALGYLAGTRFRLTVKR